MRCYNGCPDSELQAYLDSQTNARTRLKQLHPLTSVTYFPGEKRWHVFNDYKPVGQFELTLEIAVHKALQLLKGSNQSAVNQS